MDRLLILFLVAGACVGVIVGILIGYAELNQCLLTPSTPECKEYLTMPRWKHLLYNAGIGVFLFLMVSLFLYGIAKGRKEGGVGKKNWGVMVKEDAVGVAGSVLSILLTVFIMGSMWIQMMFPSSIPIESVKVVGQYINDSVKNDFVGKVAVVWARVEMYSGGYYTEYGFVLRTDEGNYALDAAVITNVTGYHVYEAWVYYGRDEVAYVTCKPLSNGSYACVLKVEDAKLLARFVANW